MSIFDGLPAALPLRSDGVVLHARRLGEGPRLVLLHGGPGLDHHVVLPLAVPLSRRFEVLLPDLPGHGRSHPAGAGLPDLGTLLERTARWIEELAPPASIVIGHSLGAWLAREIIARGRIRPRAAVLISPPVPCGDGRGERPARSWTGGRRSRRRAREGSLARKFLEACAEDSAGPPSAGFAEALSRSRLRSPTEYDALLGQLRRKLGSPLRSMDPGCPVLVLAGETDSACPPEQARRLGAATTGARVQILEGAGHVPFSAEADPVVRPILRFLDPGFSGPHSEGR